MSEAPVFTGEACGPLACRLDDSSGGVVRVVATGEIDMASAPLLDDALRDAHARGGLVVVDLRGVSFCDSTGLHALITADRRARGSGRRLVILQGPPQLQRLFALTHLAEQLEIVHDAAMILDAGPGLATVGDRPL